ncbi:PqqD family protein [Salinibacter grassmerensis]|uniref:PqqD family protein n=1 Tax=Salinibacter grassmerensis TaxID=3040353 RepID=UPI0021E7E7A5|nr:PqqD family protein [Salinibacter grassmerensis]
MASLDDSIAATNSFASAEVEDERILLDPETGTYYGLNPVGDHVLRMVEDAETGSLAIRSVVDALHDAFPDEDYERIAEDVLTFIDEMEDFDLLLVRD